MKPEMKIPRKYKLSEKALRQRRKAAKGNKGGTTVFQAVNIPKVLFDNLDTVKYDGEPNWRPIARAIRVLLSIHAMRDKLSSQSDPEIKGLIKLLEEHDDNGEA